MAHHTPNRRGLSDTEITELDATMAEYEAARETARLAMVEAQIAYQTAVAEASVRRDDRLLSVISAASDLGRGTQARIAEHLKMNPSYLAVRVRKARARTANPGDGESATPA